MAKVVPPCPFTENDVPECRFTQLHPVCLLLDKKTSNDEPGLVRKLAQLRAEEEAKRKAEEAKRKVEEEAKAEAELIASYEVVTSEEASNAEDYVALFEILAKEANSHVSDDVLETYEFVTRDDAMTSSETENRGTTLNLIPRIIRNFFVK